MDEQVRGELVRWLTAIGDRAGQAEDFVIEQAPLVAQEIVTWGVVGGLTRAAGCLLILIGQIMLLRICLRPASGIKKENDRTPAKVAAWVLMLVCMIAPAVGTFDGVSGSVKAYVAPRLFLIHQLTDISIGK